jgi:hypothetical protein
MATKTLNVNSEYFSLGGKKQTKKNRSSTPKMDLKPIISANSLKHKLLNRIKEHKNKEIKSLEKEEKETKENKGSIQTNSTSSIHTNSSPMSISNEFEESLNYLKGLSESRKKNMSDKTTKGGTGNNDTRKNKIDTYTSSVSQKEVTEAPFVELDLPDSLKEPSPSRLVPSMKPVTSVVEPPKKASTQPQVVVSNPTTNTTSISIFSNMKPNYNIDEDVPYGVLKGGLKPTYRQWNKTVKVNRPFLSNPNPNSNPPTQVQTKPNPVNNQPDSSTVSMISTVNSKTNNVPSTIPVMKYIEPQIQPSTNLFKEDKKDSPVTKSHPLIEEPTIKKTKRTIKSRYTLGKSKKNNTVSILLKNKNTRKNILNAQKELKKKSIHDIKKYLLSHNLIKIGSNAPNDVLRKIYESSMLSGEIVNHNDETLLHNLMKDTEGNNNE